MREAGSDKEQEMEIKDEKKRLLGRAWAHAQLGMYDEAVEECKKLVELDSSDPPSFIELGFLQERGKKLEEAIECYHRVMKRFPDCAAAYVNLGYIYQTSKKRPDIAMVCYEKALELNPKETWAVNNIGTILQQEGKWEEAAAHYSRAADLAGSQNLEKKHLRTIIHNLAWAYYRCRKYKQAWDAYRVLAIEYPEDASIWSDFGCVAYKIGKYGEAVELFNEALRLLPNSRYYKRLWKAANKKAQGAQ